MLVFPKKMNAHFHFATSIQCIQFKVLKKNNKEVKVSFSGEKLNPCINLLTRKGELPSENFSRDERRSN